MSHQINRKRDCIKNKVFCQIFEQKSKSCKFLNFRDKGKNVSYLSLIPVLLSQICNNILNSKQQGVNYQSDWDKYQVLEQFNNLHIKRLSNFIATFRILVGVVLDLKQRVHCYFLNQRKRKENVVKRTESPLKRFNNVIIHCFSYQGKYSLKLTCYC